MAFNESTLGPICEHVLDLWNQRYSIIKCSLKSTHSPKIITNFHEEIKKNVKKSIAFAWKLFSASKQILFCEIKKKDFHFFHSKKYNWFSSKN